MSLPTMSVTARIAADVEMRPTQTGTPMAKLRLVANSRRLNKQTDQWEDADTWWGTATAFGRTAEAIADAGLAKGDLVTVTGRIKTRDWEDKATGAKRSVDEVTIDTIGRALAPQRQGGGQQNSYAANGSFGQPRQGDQRNGWTTSEEAPF